MEIKNSKKCTKNSEIKANTNNTNNTSKNKKTNKESKKCKNSTKLNNSKNKLSLNDLTIKKTVEESKIDSNKPLVSVIVTICNTAHLLHSCIESIVEQTYTNLEIILIDSYSIDGSFKVCEKFASKDSRIKFTCDVFKSESDMRNYGLSQATGDYITFVSGSDFISLNYIEYQLEIIQKYNADISECEFIKVPEIVSAENSFEPPKQNVERITEFLPWQAIENLHSISHNTCVRTVVLWNKLYKKYIFDDIRFPEDKRFEDEFTTYKLFRKAKKIVCSNQILYAYVQIGTFKNRSYYDEHRLDILEAYENYMKFFKEMKSHYMLERAGRRYLRIMLIIRKEMSAFDKHLPDKRDTIKRLDARFKTIYNYLNVLCDKYPYLADTKPWHQIYYNKYNTYIKLIQEFNKENLKYEHNRRRQSL